jgi:hypothetical protein
MLIHSVPRMNFPSLCQRRILTHLPPNYTTTRIMSSTYANHSRAPKPLYCTPHTMRARYKHDVESWEPKNKAEQEVRQSSARTS